MNQPVTITGRFFSIVATTAEGLKPSRALCEAVHSPIVDIGGELQRYSREFGHTAPSSFKSFAFQIPANSFLFMPALVTVAQVVKSSEGWS